MPYGRLPVITVKELSRFEMKFDLAETDVSMANAIRRTMIADVPTIAIDLVTVLENTSALHDEYIVHRLGLIPLFSERVDEFENSQDCMSCDDFCPKCSVKFKLSVTAPASSTPRAVTSKDLMCDEHESEVLCHSVVPVHDSGNSESHIDLVDKADAEKGDPRKEPTEHLGAILIARLTRGQKINMVAIARKGIGKDHAKWSPMCTVAYRIVPPAVELVLDRINSLFSQDQKRELLAAAEGLLRLDEHSGNLEYETPFKLGRIAITPDTTRKSGQLAMAAGGAASEVVRYNPKPERFEFVAESTGAIKPEKVLAMALNILQKKIGDLMSHQR